MGHEGEGKPKELPVQAGSEHVLISLVNSLVVTGEHSVALFSKVLYVG